MMSSKESRTIYRRAIQLDVDAEATEDSASVFNANVEDEDRGDDGGPEKEVEIGETGDMEIEVALERVGGAGAGVEVEAEEEAETAKGGVCAEVVEVLAGFSMEDDLTDFPGLFDREGDEFRSARLVGGGGGTRVFFARISTVFSSCFIRLFRARSSVGCLVC